MLKLHRRFVHVLSMIAFIGLAPAAFADSDRHLAANGWEEMTFDGKPMNMFILMENQVLEVRSEGSVSVLQKSLNVDLDSTPILTWQWSLAAEAPPTDLTIKGEDDRSLALYVAFPFQPEEATFFEKIERRLVESRAGPDAPGRVLMYVWGGEGERGDVLKSPYLGEGGRMIILRPAGSDLDRWFEERIDVAEDYRQIFGSEAPPVMSIAVSSDTDDTESLVQGMIANLIFVERSAGS